MLAEIIAIADCGVGIDFSSTIIFKMNNMFRRDFEQKYRFFAFLSLNNFQTFQNPFKTNNFYIFTPATKFKRISIDNK